MKKAAIQAAHHNPEDFLKAVQKNHVLKGHWIYAFGWDQNKWIGPLHTLQLMDQIFPEQPVFLLRADGHAAWVNSKAAQEVNHHFHGEQLQTGFVAGPDLHIFRQALGKKSPVQMKEFALAAQEIFLEKGFTHLRDMSGTEQQWMVLSEMERNGQLKIFIEQNFFIEKESDFAEVLKVCLQARQEKHTHLRAVGLKIFYDGALGSEGALLSQCYCQSQKKGYQYHSDEFVLRAMKACAAHQLQLAVHTIGDEAAHKVLKMASDLKAQGINFELHLEHVELLRDETLLLMKEVRPVCHMQPSHWLSDHAWLAKKIGSLEKQSFRWADLLKLGIRHHWGSDAPVSEASLQRTIQGLQQSAEKGVAPYLDVMWKAHVHPDKNWGATAVTEFNDDWSVRSITL